jgi:sterol desaturase/sphingolipid hydroxylase (fatty acid hydroxylase superfamily)
MESSTQVASSIATIGLILGTMVLVAAVEAILPLHARGRWNRAHLAPNLALTGIAFAVNVVLNGALVAVLAWGEVNGIGVLHEIGAGPAAAIAVAVIGLDFAFYVAHVAMHKVPTFWRFHAVHHSDPAVDVTTTVRQHPGESLIRNAFTAAFAVVLGVTPAGYAAYRVWYTLNGLLEHANVRVPRRLDEILALVVVTPNMHKVHHSRRVAETDSNYGNIFSVFDRALRTFTPTERGLRIDYGLDGRDVPHLQTTRGLLAMPFRSAGSRVGATDAGASTTPRVSGAA